MRPIRYRAYGVATPQAGVYLSRNLGKPHLISLQMIQGEIVMKIHRLFVLIVSALAAAVSLAACQPGSATEPATPTVSDEPETTPTTMPAASPQATASPTAEAAGTPTAEGEAPDAALSARETLAQQLEADPADIAIVSAEPVEWPDSCLGVQVAGTMCLQVITPGYRVTLEAGGEQYVFHTDQDGNAVVQAEGPQAEEPQAEVADAVVNWSGTVEGVCQAATIGSNGVIFGPCDGPTTTGELTSEERAEDLAYFLSKFASFEAETPAGMVEFNGQGDTVATPAEQRMIAEWAQLVALEAASGLSDESQGLIFAWHREGGIAGFCEDVTVYATGVAYATSCAGNEPQELGRARLDANQLATAFNWVDTLQSFEYEHTDPATADALTIRISFFGTGNMEVTEDERQAIEAMAVELLAQAQNAPTE